MKTAEIRRRWLEFFEARGHAVVPSASVISSDPSILFNIAGMVQFIPYLTGREPAPFNRATSVQKCVRTADIEEVGKTTRHGTFFQMNGNFSFGDYFKREAIRYAWQLLTAPESEGGLGFDPQLLWVTVHRDDEDAIGLWREESSVPLERIQKRGNEDNFWHTGQPGPGGYCSEIYFDRGPDYGLEGGPEADEDRYIEIWNLVFMEFELGEVRSKTDFDIKGELPAKNIDTGMGLERVAFLKQGVANMYEIDEVYPVIAAASDLSGKAYGANEADDVRMRVVADHVRSALIIIGDGVRPANEGRGYILRRLLRRAVRAMRLLGVTEPVLPALLPVSRDAMQASYPELASDFDRISRIAHAEETAFLRTLESGTQLLARSVDEVGRGGTLGGDVAFALHDTHGFPIDLTLEMAAESGVTVDEGVFRSLMDEQRQRAKRDAKSKKGGQHADLSAFTALLDEGRTEFVGYDNLTSGARIRGLVSDGAAAEVAGPGDTLDVVLDTTPFYAEAGGQRADVGIIRGDGFTARVTDVQSPLKGLPAHRVEILDGELRVGADVSAEVDPAHRRGSEQAHSATHLVHAALREILGPNAVQAGSLNQPGYLRFDYSFPEALSAQTRAEIEEAANAAVSDDLDVSYEFMPFERARESGAMALFGEKYPEIVRVVDIGGPFSRELCGGTHVSRTAEVGPISIVSESSVGSGTRRIEAGVGMDAFRSLTRDRTIVQALSDLLKVPGADVPERVSGLLERIREAERSIAKLNQEKVLSAAADAAAAAQDIGGVRTSATALGPVAGGGDVRAFVLDVRGRLGTDPAVIAAVGEADGKPSVVVAVNDAAQARGLRAGDLVRAASTAMGGGGGGKADVAQGGGKDASKAREALDAVVAAVREAV
ncbi:alanine--tRNA ligase [Brevibacterium sp. BRM-1]|uniref:alanine--tRNA ligase n=1 Tax=Brevibacterium sp. BRM-1 TaxID=2999062 RepID=UPI002282861A|nr:alanine--tRNA ligase [Brevibacterium sp. BRM-1]WAL40916.1 alanine--tRNA ligase [Brevibacterium sp. BRM-1]